MSISRISPFSWLLIAAMLTLGACRSQKEAETDAATVTTEAMQSQPVATEAIAPEATAAAIPLDPNVRYGVLDNGLEYYVRQNSKPENIAELRLAINAGSMQEAEDQLGLAHFVEHMCFNGTANFPKSELVDYLESIGMRFGAHLNAYTSFDETVYMLRLPTDDADKFDKGFQILEDWATAVKFEGEEIEKERGVVISEWRTRLGGDYRIAMETYPKLFYGSRYQDRFPIGEVEILENFEHERLTAFYQDWYRPDLMAVVAVGDFDPAEMEARIKETFGAIPSREGPEREVYTVPDHDETLIAVVADPEATFNRVELTYKHPQVQIETEDDFRKDLVRDLASSMLRGRLSEISQKENPPFSNSSAGFGNLVRTKGQFYGGAFVPDTAMLEGLKALHRENLRAARHGFTDTELARAKSSRITSLERQYRERDKTESRRLSMTYVQHFLTGNAVPGIEYTLEQTKAIMPEITLEEVNTAMREFLDTEARVITVTGSESENVAFPSEADVLAALEAVAAENIEPYEDNLSDAPLMETLPTPGAVASETAQEEIGVTELTFANGVKVILKPTDFKNDEISMEAFSPGGLSLYGEDDFVTGNMAVQAVTAGGIAGYDVVQLRKFLSDKVIQLAPYISELEEGFQGSCAPKDFETFLQLLHLHFIAIRPDEGAFSSMTSRMSLLYANLLNNPEIFFQLNIPKVLYDNDPRRDATRIFTEIGNIDFDRAIEIYEDRFADASDFTFVFVGNFDPEEIQPLLATYLGGLPTTDREESWVDNEVRPVQGELLHTFEKGSEPKSLVNMIYHGEIPWNTENRYLLQSTVGVLNIMLRENMREERGEVYGVGINGSTEKNPVETYRVTINFTCAPEDAAGLIEAAQSEIQALQENGPSEQNLAKVKETQRKDFEEGLQDNDFWMNQLVFAYQYGLDPNRILSATERIDALTAEDVQRGAQEFFDDSYAQFVLNPEPSEEATEGED